MKLAKLTTVVLILVVSSFAQAKEEKTPKGTSMQDYMASAKETLEKKGRAFDKKKIAARFARIDADKNGYITTDERKAFAAKRKKAKK